MNTNFGTIIDRKSWEARIVDPFSSMAVRAREARNLSKQKDNLTERGFVVWDKMINQSVFLPECLPTYCRSAGDPQGHA